MRHRNRLGISSGGILRFLDRMEEKNIELHSFMVVRHGNVRQRLVEAVCTGACAPAVFLWQNPDGNGNRFARQEKILSLEERLVDLFPELLPKEPSENLQKVTLLASPDHELRT